jgi:hypothetical protein
VNTTTNHPDEHKKQWMNVVEASTLQPAKVEEEEETKT